MKKSEVAVNKFKQGYNCAQSVLYSFSNELKITTDFALKLANGFGAGMGRRQEVCGAITGAIMVINFLYGRGENEDKGKQEVTYSKVRELIARFEEKYGTINCKKLIDGCDLLTKEGQEAFKSRNMIDRCYGYVETAVNLLEDIIKK